MYRILLTLNLMAREDYKKIQENKMSSEPKKQENRERIKILFLEEQEHFNRNVFIIGLSLSGVVVLLLILNFLDLIIDFLNFRREEMYILIELGILLLIGVIFLGLGSKYIQRKLKKSEEAYSSKLLIKTGYRVLILLVSIIVILIVIILIIFGWRIFLFLFFGIGD